MALLKITGEPQDLIQDDGFGLALTRRKLDNVGIEAEPLGGTFVLEGNLKACLTVGKIR